MSRLRDIADLRSEKVQPMDAQDSIYIGLEHIQQQTLALNGVGKGADVSSQKQRFYRGDVLFGKLRPYFRKVILAREEGICSTDIWVLRPKDEADSAFILYLLASQDFIEEATNTSEGSRMPRANWRVMSDYEFPDFTSHDRVKIGEFLSLFDEKIKENRHASALLEKTSQSLFKSWFIDFDPVKAKMAGTKLAGLSEDVASLFPSSLEDSELGDIPSGWKVVKVKELLIRIKAKGLAKSTPLKRTGKTLVLEQGDSLVAGFLDQDADVHASPALPKFIFGDHTCRMRLSTIPFSVLPNTIVLDSNDFNPYWTFQATKGIQNFETYRRHWMEFAQKTVAVPSTHLTVKFGEIVAPLYSQMDNLMLESRKLAEVRDALLPGLISGEIEIPDELLDA